MGIESEDVFIKLDLFTNTYQVRENACLFHFTIMGFVQTVAFSISLLRKQQTALSFMTYLDLYEQYLQLRNEHMLKI